jgi:hypothetical protein
VKKKKMNKTKTVLGIGIVLAVLAVLPAMAAAEINVSYFEPQHSSAETGDYDAVTIGFNLTEDAELRGAQIQLQFDPALVDIPDGYCVKGCPPAAEGEHCWETAIFNHDWTHNGYMWMVISRPQVAVWKTVPPPAHWAYEYCEYFTGPMKIKMCDMYVVANATSGTPGVSPLNFGYERFPEGCPDCQDTRFSTFELLDFISINGTFTHDYAISGYANTSEGDPATKVNITNLNKPEAVDEISADVDPATGFYSLALDMSSEVEVGDELRITACRERADDYYESHCNVTNHTVVTAPGHETNVNLTLNHYCLDLLNFPFWEVNTTVLEAHNGTGAATAQMNLDYMWWNESVDDEPPVKYNQSYLYDYGLAHNAGDNLEWFDTQGMWYTIQYLDPSPYSEYGYNFGLNHGTDYEDMLNRICHWVAYTVGSVGGHKDGHPYHVPGAVPAYGDYTNWMSIRGLHTNEDPAPSTWVTPENLEVYGFWVNDPYPASLGGIGENSYKTADEWNLTYYKPLNTGDQWDGEYVAILEPPEGDLGDITIVHSKARFDGAITPMLAEEPMMLYGIEQLALEKVVKDDELLKIVKAAIDGVNEELIPFDSEFAEVFAKTVPGKPKLVTSDNGDYYVVPFNVPVKERPQVKIMPVEIERPKIGGLKKLERMKRVADRIERKPIPIEPIRVEKTLVVVLVNAEDGSFKEASWVKGPVKYLPVSKIEAMKLAVGEVLDELHVVAKKDARDLEVIQQRPTIELVYTDASPYYPDWKVTVNGKVFYVSQDGTVSN